MFTKILWVQITVIILFIAFEFYLKATITNEAKRIYFEKTNLPDLSDEPFFKNSKPQDSQQYFFDNAGIFLRPLYPGLSLFASADSILMFSALISAILSLIFTTYLQALCFAIIFVFMMFISPMPVWYPFLGNNDMNFERTLHNHHIGGIDPLHTLPYEVAFKQYNEMVAEYIQDKIVGKSEQINTTVPHKAKDKASFQNEITNPNLNGNIEKELINNNIEKQKIVNKGTIRETFKDLLLKEYKIPLDEIKFIGFYHILMKNREEGFKFDGFERLFFFFICNEAKNPNDSRLPNFNKTNRHYDFKTYNEEKDDKYYEDDTDFYDDTDYFPKKEYDEDSLTSEELDYLFGDGRYDALMDRVILRDWLLPFLEIRKEIRDIKIEDIQSNIEYDTQKLITLKQKQDEIYNEIFKEKAKLEKEQGGSVLISMNYSAAEKFQPEINKLEFKNKILTNVYELLKKNQIV